MISIGQMAARFGVSLRTLRFYQERGLLHPMVRGTTRTYTEEHAERLTLILRLRDAGFTLAEMKVILADRTKLPAMLREREEQAHEEQQKAVTCIGVIADMKLDYPL